MKFFVSLSLLFLCVLIIVLYGCKSKNYWQYIGDDGYSYKSYRGNEINDFVSEVSEITNLNGVVSLHYGDGQMYAEYHLTNNIIQGTIKYWNGQGQIIMHATYTNGLANGVYKTWHDNGVLASISSYSNDVPSWDGESWYDNGSKSSENYWIDKNLKILRERDWDKKGNLIADGVSSNLSSINGTFIVSQIEGQPPKIAEVTNGVLVRKYYYQKNAEK